MNRSDQSPSSTDYRRLLVLLVAVTLLIGWAITKWQGSGGSGTFAAAAMGRIGLVMGALWLAWPSLRKPANWLPPGMPVVGVILLAVLAAQPRLVFVAVPAFIGLLTLGTVIRTFRG